MTAEQAHSLAVWLGTLIPTMTEEQVVKVVSMFAPLEYEAASKRLDRYAERTDSFSVASFKAAMREGDAAGDAADRTRQEIKSLRDAEQQVAAHWTQIDALVAAMPADRRQRIERKILAHLEAVMPAFAQMVRRVGVQESKLMRSLVATESEIEL